MTTGGLAELDKLREAGLKTLYPGKIKICVGTASCGLASGAAEVLRIFEEEVKSRPLDWMVSQTGCMGYCQREPIVSVTKPGWPRIIYADMDVKKTREVVNALAEGKIIPEYALCRISEENDLVQDVVRKYPLNGHPSDIDKVPDISEVPFFGKQNRRILRNCGLIDPDSIEEYAARGGYRALYKALTGSTPEIVIEEVTNSGLRGRGGAGFPTGRKWAGGRKAKSDVKFVICNADEGDPGAYMDRGILEGDTHSVIEGMAIGAFAVGARSGYVYVRAEYPLAVKRVKHAIEEAMRHGFLGKNIFGSGFDFTLDVECGSGAFVAGELSAMISSIEGSTAEPRQRPPGTTEKGLWGKPTVTNNVKTWANVPLVISRGAAWFGEIGTDKCKGTMVFSLVGKVNNTGLVEVPMGTKLRSLVYDIGEGITGDKKLKAVQAGGPSGGCIPENLLDLPVDYEKLTEAGSMMGSGGMVVMDEDTCMVDVAKYFLSFTKDESCGKCVPCREGCTRMYEILCDITEGRGQEGDIALLEDLGNTIIDSALCGLGNSAPNPALTTIRYFKDEYEAHIKEKRCPGLVCKHLISYFIEPEKCRACGTCRKECPTGAIEGEKGKIHVISQKKCTKCGTCFDVCPKKYRAVTRLSGVPVPEAPPMEKRTVSKTNAKEAD